MTRPRLKPIALPAEHGIWGMLLEPALLGLVAAASLAGWWLAGAALAAVLTRQPLRVLLLDVLAGQRRPRTRWAAAFVMLYGVPALGCVAAAWYTAGWTPFVPLLWAAPLGVVCLWFDARKQSRALTPELLGSVALSALAPAILLAGNIAPATAYMVWLVLAAKQIATVLYVRARLRLEKGKPTLRWPALATHGALLALTLAWARWPAILAAALVGLRASAGLSPWRRPSRATRLGMLELVHGVTFALLLAWASGME